MYKAIIFDLDGTLLNTLEDLTDSLNYALQTYQYPPISLQQARDYVGSGAEKFLELSLESGKQNKHFEDILTLFKQHYSTNMDNKTKPYENVMELIIQLKEKGIKLAIASNKFDSAVQQINEQYFQGLFDEAIGESKGISKKPAPDMVYHALKCLGVDKSDACYVGDSDVDFATAKNADIEFIAVSWGFRDKQLLASLGAKKIADDAEQLVGLILV